MTCRYCGTVLPDGALFCGECGQPVTAAKADDASTGSSLIVAAARSARSEAAGADGDRAIAEVTGADSEQSAAPTVGFSIADLAFSSPGETSQPDDDDRDLPDGSPLVHGDPGDPASRCPQCGEAMAKGDVFCGECGFVLRVVSPPSGGNLITLGEFPADPEAPDAPGPDAEGPDADATTEVERLSSDDGGDNGAEADAEDDVDDDDADEGDGGAVADAAEIDQLVVESGPPSVPAAAEPDPDLEFDDPLPFSEHAVATAAQASPRSRPIPDPFPWGTDQPLREDLEATRLVADSAPGARYVLQFSTGESVTVAGSGLVGRNPSMQPGEYVDQLVPIFDAGKSVSKTHLEFGQEAGRFWVSDRYSTNGSVIRQPDAEPRRCDAGRRYFIARGTRVDVGEQFFVVS
jgi:uncharacterized Zn finger protein (UPF0148 family)